MSDGTPPSSSARQSPAGPRPARRALVVGFILVICAFALILSPLFLGRWDFNKYIVFIGILAACFGVTCILNGAIDLWRGKR